MKSLRDSNSKEYIPQINRRCQIPGVRYLFAFMGFLGFCTIYAIRVNINVAIVAMVNSTAVYSDNNKSSSHECEVAPSPFNTNQSNAEDSNDGKFLWTPKMQGVILGAFYYGYCISQIPGGRLAEIFSGKWVFGIGTVFTALLTLLTPIAAECHVGVLIAIRALEGLAQGVTMPAMHSMLGRWLPDSEKSILVTLVYTGINIGTVAAMPLSGALCNSDLFGGWPSAFYAIGLFGCLWFVLWCILVTDSPVTHPLITQKELHYIMSNQTIKHNTDLPSIPWKKIFTSVPFWALIITQTGQDWCFYTLVNDLPTYFATILHFKLEKSGFLSSFPHLLQCACGLIVALGADAAIRSRAASMNFVRKFCNSVSGFGSALGLIGVMLAGCDVTANIAIFMTFMTVGGFCYSGYMVTHIDMSPEYAGTLIGITNTISNLTGFLAPLVVGALTEQYQTLHQWRIVFTITVALLCVTTLAFIFFATARNQQWATRSSSQKAILNSVSEENVTKEYGAIK